MIVETMDDGYENFDSSNSSLLSELSLEPIEETDGTPLSLEVQMVTKQWQDALDTIEEYPEVAKEWQYVYGMQLESSDNEPQAWKRLPIHLASVLHAPVDVIDALHLAYPKGVQSTDPYTGELPLHLACRHSAPPELIKMLIMAHPNGAQVRDLKNRLPLYWACAAQEDSHLFILYLLAVYPFAVLLGDETRRTPLQYAKINPSLNRATVKFLTMMHTFLKARPSVEDEYTFNWFAES